MRARRILIIAVLALALAATEWPRAGAAPGDGTEVYGGQPADPGEYPFMVGLTFRGVNWQNGFHCGGTLISPDTVLTAAHCMFDQQGQPYAASRFEVLIGTLDRADTSAIRARVRRIRLHPGYDRPTFRNDAAILQLDRSVTQEPVVLALPPDQPSYAAGGTGWVTGWGAREDIGPGFSRRYLIEAEVPLVTDVDCATHWGTRFDATTMTCAGSSAFAQPAPCSGDSGGPLLIDDGGQWLQIGITSWGDSSCTAAPSVFAEVAAFSDFIGPYLDPDDPPGAVRNLRAQRRTNHRALVQWSAPDWDGGTAVRRYRIELPALGRVHFVPATWRSKLLRNLPNGVNRIVVRAVNDIGPGDPAEVLVTI